MNRMIIGWAAALVAAMTAPALAGEWSGEIGVGGIGLNSSSRETKYEEYRELAPAWGPEGNLLFKGDAFNLSIGLEDTSGDNRQVDVNVSGSKLDAGFYLRGARHLYSETAKTIYTDLGNGVYVLPDSFQAYNEANPGTPLLYNSFVNFMNNEGRSVTVGFRDTLVGGEVGYQASSNLKITAGGSQKKREGNRALSVPFGFSYANEVLEPLDQITTEARAGLDFTPGKLSVRVGGGVSTFENAIGTLTVDSGYRLTDRANASYYSSALGASKGAYDLNPNNQAVDFSLAVSSNHIKRTQVSARAAFAHVTQNDPFLPYTTNMAMIPGAYGSPSIRAWDIANLPQASLNGSVYTTSLLGQVTNNSIKNLKLTARYKDYELRNLSDAITFVGHAVFDQNWVEHTESNHHFQFKTGTFEGEANYELLKKVDLSVGAFQTDIEREAREVLGSTEQGLKGGVGIEPVKGYKAGCKFVRAWREVEHFDLEEGIYLDDLGYLSKMPGERRYDTTNRFNRVFTADASAQILKNARVDVAWTVQKNNYAPEDNANLAGVGIPGYDAQNQELYYGLLSDQSNLESVAISYSPVSRLSLGGYADRQIVDSMMRSNNNNSSAQIQEAARDWQVFFQEKYITWTADVDVDAGKGVGLSGAYDRVNSWGSMRTVYAQPGEIDLPDTTSFLEGWTVKCSYKIDKTWSTKLFFRHEQYRVTDFQNQNLPYIDSTPGTGGAMTSVWLGDNKGNYTAKIGGMQIAAAF